MLKDFGEKVPAADKGVVETALADLKSALQGEDKDAIEQKIDAVAQASMKLGEALYQSSQGAAAGGAGSADSGGGDGKEDVVDVDFEEVKDDDSKKSA
jgi:molecular chaperone DnaK